MEYGKLQQKVIDGARKRLSSELWFKDLCLDSLPSDKYINTSGIEPVIDQVVSDTQMRDDPDGFELDPESDDEDESERNEF